MTNKIQDLFVNLRVVDSRRIETDQGPIVEIDLESMTSPLLSCRITIPSDVAEYFVLTPGTEV
jgi:hypothetical protein